MTTIKLPTLTEDERLLAIAGDWHCNWRWAVYSLGTFRARGIHTVFQLGDFGVWPDMDGRDFAYEVNKVCEELDMHIYVTLGNHEDYNMVSDIQPDDLGLRWYTPRIALLPRVARFTHRNLNFLSLGGAPSIDFLQRTVDIDWFPAEMLTEQEVNEAAAGGPADVMLTHDAPDMGTARVQKIIQHNPQGWPPKALRYAKEGRDLMTRAVQHVQPQVLMHGHYHIHDNGYISYGEDYGIIHSFGMDGVPGNLAVFDTDDIYKLTFINYERP